MLHTKSQGHQPSGSGEEDQGSKIVLVRSYLRVSQAAGQVNILIFLLKIKFSPCMPINFVMQGKCLFSDISRPEDFKRVFTIYGYGYVGHLVIIPKQFVKILANLL